MYSKSCLLILVLCLFKCIQTVTLKSPFDVINSREDFVETLQNVLPKSQTRLSTTCQEHLGRYLLGLNNSETWAFQMFDASSKFPSGILKGNIFDLGSFDECLEIENGNILGRYCIGSFSLLPPPNTTSQELLELPRIITPRAELPASLSLSLATCLPAACSTTDIRELYEIIGITVYHTDNACQSKDDQPEFDGASIGATIFYGLFIIIFLLSSTYDAYLLYSKKESPHLILTAFSFLSNGKKIITLNKSSSQISCLHGIRVLSILWVIVAHRFQLNSNLPTVNSLDTLEWMNDEKNLYMTNATLCVDTFLLIGGLVVCYAFLSAMAKGMKFNILMFYIHRYIRLTPVFAAVIIVYIGLLIHLGSGPLWIRMLDVDIQNCRSYWWLNLLYVHNYVNAQNMCMPITWYLAVDTQIFLVSPILLLPLRKRPAMALAAAGFLVLCSMAGSIITIWYYELYAPALSNLLYGNRQQYDDYYLHYYRATHTRASVWLIGMILGYVIFQVKHNQKKIIRNKMVISFLWVVSLLCLGVCVFTGHNAVDEEFDMLQNIMYAALHRPAWALGLSWVIYACVSGSGGLINWFLSLSVFEVLGKLTYSMYLSHVLVLTVTSQIRTSLHFSTLKWFHEFLGDAVLSIVVALFFTLIFESPIIILEKVIFGGGRGKDQKVKKLKEASNENDKTLA